MAAFARARPCYSGLRASLCCPAWQLVVVVFCQLLIKDHYYIILLLIWGDAEQWFPYFAFHSSLLLPSVIGVVQEWQQSTLTHTSIVRDLIDLQLNQYQQVVLSFYLLSVYTWSTDTLLHKAPLTLSPPIPLTLYTLPYWSNLPFLIFDIRALWRSGLSARVPECQKLKTVS